MPNEESGREREREVRSDVPHENLLLSSIFNINYSMLELLVGGGHSVANQMNGGVKNRMVVSLRN